jgi:peptidoglycan/xylan/chitin deacetylase (PgdA/CDA1 family)
MPIHFLKRRIAMLAAGLLLSATAATGPSGAPVVRFLLSFDDGPSAVPVANPTRAILDRLADNPVQPGIKAVFFVQTRNRGGGGTDIGRALLERMHVEGHVLALHSGTPRGHINHTRMPLDELTASLAQGTADLRRITGRVPRYIRPPYWAYNLDTLARYRAQGLGMLLDDVAFGDGKIHGYSSNRRTAALVHAELSRVAAAIHAGLVPALDGVYPVVVTLHDTNPATARDLDRYLAKLVRGAAVVGLVVAERPFYDATDNVDRVLALRAVHEPHTRTSLAPARHTYQ